MTAMINSVLEIDGASYRIISRRGSEFILFRCIRMLWRWRVILPISLMKPSKTER